MAMGAIAASRRKDKDGNNSRYLNYLISISA